MGLIRGRLLDRVTFLSLIQSQNLSISLIQVHCHHCRLIRHSHNHHHRNQIQMTALRSRAKNFHLMPTKEVDPPVRYLHRRFQLKKQPAPQIQAFSTCSCWTRYRPFLVDLRLKQQIHLLVLRCLHKTEIPHQLRGHRVMQLWAVDSHQGIVA